MKTIVIPSDFSQHSIHVAETVIRNSNEPVKLIFTHLFRIGDSIQDLLFSTYRKREHEFVSDQFKKDCNELLNLFGEIFHSYKIEFFYGNRLAPFKHFLEYHQVDGIAYSSSYGVPLISKSSLDASPIIKKAGVEVFDIDQVNSPVVLEKY